MSELSQAKDSPMYAAFIGNDGTRTFSWETGIRHVASGKTYQRETHQWFFFARLRHRKMRRIARKWGALVAPRPKDATP